MAVFAGDAEDGGAAGQLWMARELQWVSGVGEHGFGFLSSRSSFSFVRLVSSSP